MNKSYNKPSTTLQTLKLEGAFMRCSTRVDGTFTVKAFEEAAFDGGSKEWDLTFQDPIQD